MKTIKNLNIFALSLPVFLAIFSMLFNELIFWLLLSFVLTGVLQIVIGIVLLFKSPRDRKLILYFVLVILFFVAWYANANSGYDRAISIALIGFAPLLAIYLTIIVHLKQQSNSSFMTAEWNDLAIINYETNPEILKRYLPLGTELDLWNGKCYISLIGFMFENVRVLGFKVPYHTDFEEVNLRFYVKRFENNVWKRGVVFVKEIVPKHAITVVANTLYKEHYETMPMRNFRSENDGSKFFRYEWKKGQKWNSLSVKTSVTPIDIEINSEAEFITEHYFGYTRFNNTKTIEYEVTHPRWQQLEVIEYDVNVDFEHVYGKDFMFLKDLKPCSAFLAIGSAITIEGKKTFKA